MAKDIMKKNPALSASSINKEIDQAEVLLTQNFDEVPTFDRDVMAKPSKKYSSPNNLTSHPSEKETFQVITNPHSANTIILCFKNENMYIAKIDDINKFYAYINDKTVLEFKEVGLEFIEND